MPQTVRLTDQAYVEMVCSLFSTKLTTAIMGCSFLAVGGLAMAETMDLYLQILLVAGGIAAIARFLTILYHSPARQAAFNAVSAGKAERRFAVAYLLFALIFGIFAARAFPIVPPRTQLLLVGLLFGYGAGVAAGISLRPWICIPASLMAIVPTIIVTLFVDNGDHWGLGLLTSLFLAGGIESMLRRYRLTAKQLTLEHLFSMVGRRDNLTGLPNELAMREYFASLAAAPAAGTTMVAVHVIAVHGLPQINSEVGHVRGDELLKAVAERLQRSVHFGDPAVRLAGARFAVLQAAVDHPRLAESFAQELHASLSRTYAIGGLQLNPPIHIGYASDVQRGASVDHLLPSAMGAADAAGAENRPVVRAQQRRW